MGSSCGEQLAPSRLDSLWVALVFMFLAGGG